MSNDGYKGEVWNFDPVTGAINILGVKYTLSEAMKKKIKVENLEVVKGSKVIFSFNAKNVITAFDLDTGAPSSPLSPAPPHPSSPPGSSGVSEETRKAAEAAGFGVTPAQARADSTSEALDRAVEKVKEEAAKKGGKVDPVVPLSSGAPAKGAAEIPPEVDPKSGKKYQLVKGNEGVILVCPKCGGSMFAGFKPYHFRCRGCGGEFRGTALIDPTAPPKNNGSGAAPPQGQPPATGPAPGDTQNTAAPPDTTKADPVVPSGEAPRGEGDTPEQPMIWNENYPSPKEIRAMEALEQDVMGLMAGLSDEKRRSFCFSMPRMMEVAALIYTASNQNGTRAPEAVSLEVRRIALNNLLWADRVTANFQNSPGVK